jgi:hypothetical protein
VQHGHNKIQQQEIVKLQQSNARTAAIPKCTGQFIKMQQQQIIKQHTHIHMHTHTPSQQPPHLQPVQQQTWAETVRPSP